MNGYPRFGSWNWIGADLSRALATHAETLVFRETVPDCDAVVFVKFKPALPELKSLARRCAVIYCPVDLYGSAAEIDADYDSLICCRRIIVHCERLRRYFSAYAPVEYLDHHLKFVAPMPVERPTSGPILWVANHSNLPPLVDWANQSHLSEELWVLTDGIESDTSSRALGFSPGVVDRLENWTPERHREWTSQARVAVDIKGDSFRARHKPPAKALDFIASGLPLAMNQGSSPAQHLGHLGLDIPFPEQTDIWFSPDYWSQVQALGQNLRQQLSLENVARQLLQIVELAVDG